MKREGMILLVVSVLITLLAVVLVWGIYRSMSYEVIRFSPEPELDCLGIDFVAGIVRGQTNYFEVVNRGNLPIGGFYIEKFSDGKLYVYEEIVKFLPPGKEGKWVLEKDFGPGRYLVVPRVEGEDLEGGVYLRPCKKIYAQELVLS